MLAVILFALFTGRIEVLSLGAIISFTILIYKGKSSLAAMNPPGGYANWVTGSRLILIITGSFLFAVASKYVILAIMLSAVLLDAVDGFLARRYGQSTEFGTYFDLEIDAFIVLILCFYYYQYAGIGMWILIPGLLRYVYKVLIVMIPKSKSNEQKSKHASIIAGIFYVILLSGIVLPVEMKAPTLLVGVLTILTSFVISFIKHLQLEPELNRNG